ncbi:hypothetical protein MtrunA17_Chr8g0355341 [Medicago truncatula]|uniref:Uncharacterized protein n=1 Tax=Medicago truncatula TaxID=3880 RepID=A0A396GP54_MEDTR|nr:hypothetical protein MtrunA17_Chr8g0355341 [Medicago truncatula]
MVQLKFHSTFMTLLCEWPFSHTLSKTDKMLKTARLILYHE